MAGDILDQRVRIDYQASTTDPVYGQQPGDWVPLDTVWGKVTERLPFRSQERGGPAVHVESKNIVVRIRWRGDIDTSMRIVLVDRASRILRIVGGPVEVGRRQYEDILCEEFTIVGDAA